MNQITGLFLIIYSISLGLLLFAEYKNSSKLRAIFKTFTSSLFLAFAINIIYQYYHKTFQLELWIIFFFLAIFFGWLGDLLLIPENKPTIFKLGVLAFLLGHLGYIFSYFAFSWNWSFVFISMVLTIISGSFILKWLWKSIPENFKVIVISYIIVISIMVITSIGVASNQHLSYFIIPGSLLFYLSDIAVAKSRFVDGPSFKNRIWGLPTYYYGQILLILALQETLLF